MQDSIRRFCVLTLRFSQIRLDKSLKQRQYCTSKQRTPQMTNIYQQRINEWLEKYGGLSDSAEAKINKLLADFVKEIELQKDTKAFQISIGTKLIREYNGKSYCVIVTETGFEYKDKIYKSLSAIANLITGKHWNGKKFFGVI